MTFIEQKNVPDSSESGMALLLVLWFVLVMSMITAMAMNRESESTKPSLARHDVETTRHLADAGAYRAVALLMDPDWQKNVSRDGIKFDVNHNGAILHIRVARENMKLDIATADEDTLSAQLASHPHIVRAIIHSRREWQAALRNNQRHSANIPAIPSLTSLMSRADESQLRSSLTPHTAAMSLQLGKPPKRTISNRIGQDKPLERKVDGTFSIESRVITAGAVGLRYAVVRIYTDSKGNPQYHILEWT